jgi:hypothetical protein
VAPPLQLVQQPIGLELLRKDLGVWPVQDHDTWQQQNNEHLLMTK